jgi:CheY-like chemotaxis protein
VPGVERAAGARPALGRAARSLRILLTEDNPVNQVLAVRLLEKRGHSVAVAGNGREALAALGRERFDVVLMDVQMPEMDGFETTAALRARERDAGTRVPVVAMTAYAMKGDKERCLAAGMDGYISKPLRPRDLFEAVEGLVAADGGGEPPADGSEAAFDPAVALARVGDDRALLKELIGLFLGECPRWLAAIREAIRQGDAGELRRAAHSIKGTVGTFGARAAFEAAQRLEAMGRDGNLAGAAEAADALEEAVRRLQPALAAFVREESAAGVQPNQA